MTFQPGSRLGHYEVLAPLGAGGGERILALRVPEESVPRSIEIVTDWTGELARRVSSGT